jgi:hypothetical protein
MARTYLLKRPTGLIKVLYTIDQAVGAGCPNLRDDVALVQFFLRAVMEDDKGYRIPAGKPLAMDGICGPRTIDYIKSWQAQDAKLSQGAAMPMQDGQISPMTNRTGIASRSHTRYAIVSLNVIYSGANGIDKHANIANDPRCQTALLPSIFWS